MPVVRQDGPSITQIPVLEIPLQENRGTRRHPTEGPSDTDTACRLSAPVIIVRCFKGRCMFT